jgi:hypothetical protein
MAIAFSAVTVGALMSSISSSPCAHCNRPRSIKNTPMNSVIVGLFYRGSCGSVPWLEFFIRCRSLPLSII